jgi:hypothetical protein
VAEAITAKQAQKEAASQMKKKPTKPPSEEYSRFEQLVRQVVAVPKSEIDKRQAQYEKSRKAAKKRKAA